MLRVLRDFRPLAFFLLFVGGLALAQDSAATGPSGPSTVVANPKLKGYDAGGGAGRTVYEIRIEGEIELGLASFVQRVIKRAKPEDVIFLNIRTFGGRVDAAVDIRDALLDAKAPTVAYVDHRAISAGALISLACDTIIMSEGASIGAATPVQMEGQEMKPTSEKVVSYMRAEMRATAQAKGRREDVAEAMVDADIEIKGVDEKGKLLTLTSAQALELKIADAVVANKTDALAVLNLGGAKLDVVESDWGEDLARILTNSTVSSLLMTFGFLGIMLELYTPGFGFAGGLGFLCLGLFFFGQYAAQLAGWEEMLLFFIGLALLGVEIFVIPGFGIVGIAGLLVIGASLVMAMMEMNLPLDVSFELGYVQASLFDAAVRISFAILAIVVALLILARYGFKTRFATWMVFQADEKRPGVELPGEMIAPQPTEMIGQRGVAHTPLRPAGIGIFGERRLDVVTEGDFIDMGAAIVVSRVDGSGIVVKKVAES